MALKFGTSGVRGLVTEMTDLACARYGAAFVETLKNRGAAAELAIAGDLRASTPRIMRAVGFAAEQGRFKVVNCGHVPTPALAEYALQRGIGSVMVTGSHIPEDRNGIKFYTPDGEISKSDEAEISGGEAALVAEGWASAAFDVDGGLQQTYTLPEAIDAAAVAYRARFLSFFEADSLSGLHVVLYEHSAVGRDLMREILEALGARVSSVGRSDRFLPVDTEAVEDPETLAAWVRMHGADVLVSTDGDSDRPLVLDETGRIVRGDVLGVLAARALGAASIAIPVSCNTLAESCGAFQIVRRTRIGSPYVIEAMNEESLPEPIVGFEANGGFLTGSDLQRGERTLEALPTRDCLLPAVATLAACKNVGQTLSQAVAALPSRFTASGLVRPFDNLAGRAIGWHLARAGSAAASDALGDAFPPVVAIDDTDGARLTLTDGSVIHFRPSGNAPEFRCYTEADSPEAAETLLAAGLDVVRDRLVGSADQWLREMFLEQNLSLMDADGPGMDVVIVSTTSLPQAEWWRKRLLQGRGQVCRTGARIAVVVEDWPGGAGNGLGTLYAFERAADYFQRSDRFDLLEALEGGASVAIYHTAGKGTRLAPLPAAESNNKPGVRLAGLVDLPGERAEITILEAVIRQTAVYAPARAGRLSVFWGDQVFIPTATVSNRATHHADVLAALGPMPSEAEWQRRGLSRYGLIAVDGAGDATQVEKVSYADAAGMVADGVLRTDGGIGVSLGSFSMSADLTEALLLEFSEELRSRTGKLDTDPHFWMPLALDRDRYISLMQAKGMLTVAARDHYRRMSDVKARLQAVAPHLGILGAVDVGQDARWWDYGQVATYVTNVRRLLADDAEARAMRAFFRIRKDVDNLCAGKGPEIVNSVLMNCRIESGRIENSVLVGVVAESATCVDAIAVDVTCEQLTATDALAYGCIGHDLMLAPREVRSQVAFPENDVVTLQTTLDRDGGADWDSPIGDNTASYADIYLRNRSLPIQIAQELRKERKDRFGKK